LCGISSADHYQVKEEVARAKQVSNKLRDIQAEEKV
jgi:hypothetical protein